MKFSRNGLYRHPTFIESLIPLITLIVFLSGTVYVFKDEATNGPSQAALITAGFVAAILAILQGRKWEDLEKAILHNLNVVGQAMLILILVGALIGTWIMGGIVPTLTVWGLKLLSPQIFLFVALLISSLVSLATGSSWSTAGTIGLALIGVANTMGIHPGLSAGAIISGAYFGDKMSPFSETTNLSSSMVGVGLFVHIRHMVYTTGPSYIITALLFLIIGFTQSTTGYNPDKIEFVITSLQSRFNTSLYMLIPVIILFIMVYKKIPAILALLIGTLLGIIMAIFFQEKSILDMAQQTNMPYWLASAKASLKAASIGFKSYSGSKEIDNLLSRGGMLSMLNTIWLIMSAMFFSGVMEGSGMLRKLAEGILSKIKSTGNLIASTVLTAVFMNITASEQYLSIVITGQMYKDAYKNQGLAAKNLSRCLEDAGTLTSPLVPWNTCGAFMAASLGVPTLIYAPFAFLNIINPIVSLIYGYTGFTIEKNKTESEIEESSKQA